MTLLSGHAVDNSVLSSNGLEMASFNTHAIAVVILFVCPSVCLSHWRSTPKRFEIFCAPHDRVMNVFSFFEVKRRISP